jgi:hypothetical protein
MEQEVHKEAKNPDPFGSGFFYCINLVLIEMVI